MNEDFVPFELAVKLKEKGFDYKCHCYYKNSIIMSHCSEPLNHNADAVTYSAPTISQVLKWLRKEKFIFIGLSPMQEYGGDKMIEWRATVYIADKHGGLSWNEEFYYQSYEQAALAGVNYCLENLI